MLINEVLTLKILNKLEKKLGHLAIRNLMTYIVGLNALVFIMILLDQSTGEGGRFLSKLILHPQLVIKGEVWRLITYVFIPPSLSPMWIIFTLYFYYLIGTSLEHEWGSFKFNMYYFIGMVGTTAAAFITGGATTAVYLNLSLFLACARLFPNYEIRLFFFFPIKIKYLGWLNWAIIGYTIITADIPVKAAAIVSIINYFLFFGTDIIRDMKHGGRAYNNKRRFYAKIPRDITIHKCEVCGKTEKDDKRLDFRYCVECQGDHEYCMEHLDKHQHVVEQK